MYRLFFKRIFDFLASFIGFFIISPLFLMVTVVLAFANHGNPFFTQLRPGRHAKIFRLIKFKTMTDAKDAKGKLLPDAERLTKVGKFIRSTSLDEIPQLINVIKGDMSLIGPRPLLIKYLDRYTKEQARRHDVRPGITGWAQVNGRNTIAWDKKLEMDVFYVDKLSFVLDLKILYLTLVKVIKREDINSATSATMEEFLGSKRNNLN